MNLGKAIKAARERHGMSQADLAKKIGVSAGTVAGWETTGEHAHGIRLDRLRTIAKALGLNVAELVA